MRHNKSYRKLGKESSHRRAMLRNLASSFFKDGRIKTTLARGRELRPIVEKLITKGKSNSEHSLRQVLSYLFLKDAAFKVYNELSKRFQDRNGGYTRIIKLGSRKGDAAEECLLELVDYSDHEGAAKIASAKPSLPEQK